MTPYINALTTVVCLICLAVLSAVDARTYRPVTPLACGYLMMDLRDGEQAIYVDCPQRGPRKKCGPIIEGEFLFYQFTHEYVGGYVIESGTAHNNITNAHYFIIPCQTRILTKNMTAEQYKSMEDLLEGKR